MGRRQTIGIDEIRMGSAHFDRFLVHFFCIARDRPSQSLGDGNSGIVPGNDHHAPQGFADGKGIARCDSQAGRFRIGCFPGNLQGWSNLSLYWSRAVMRVTIFVVLAGWTHLVG